MGFEYVVPPAQAVVTDHGALTGLADDDHPQYQAADADLSAIAALAPSNDDVIQRKSGVWVARSMAQVKIDLAVTHGDLGGVSANQHHNQAHAGDGADHTYAGLTAGHVLKATGATAASFGQLAHSQLGGVGADDHHAQAHQSAHTIGGADALTGFVPTTFVRKTADESVTSSTAVQDDDHLVLAVVANATYLFDLGLFYTGATAGDIQVGFTFPAGATILWSPNALRVAATATADTIKRNAATSGAAESGGAVTGSTQASFPRGILRTAGTAGNLQVQWAQNASDGTATTLLTDSWLLLRRVA